MADIEKILIVDDDKLNLKLLYQRLKNDSREIIEAMSGKEALDMLREHPDVYLVVLDVNMPGMDGFETAEIILSQESTKHLPILFVTASQLSDISAEKGYRVGAVDYITKPINPAILQGKVEAFLRLTRQQKQLQEINLTLEKEKAEAASTAKSVFLRNMSHSLLTPMNGILGVLELLRQEMDEESVPSQVEMIGMVKNSALSLTQILKNVLEFASADIGKVILAESKFSLETLMHSVIDPLKPEAAIKGIAIDFKMFDDVPSGWSGDVARIRQVLFILVENAVKFTKSGKIETSIEMEDNIDQKVLHFKIKDTGIGISTEHLESIFDPFFQVDDSLSRSVPGIGIGLSIARRVTELMQGKIYAESELGKGSTFHFIVPYI